MEQKKKKRCRRLYAKVDVLSAERECSSSIRAPVLYVCVNAVYTLTCSDAKILSIPRYSGSSHTADQPSYAQTCPSNSWSPWKQPSSKLVQGECSDIMEDQTEPVPALGMCCF